MPRAPETNDLRKVHAVQRHSDVSNVTKIDTTIGWYSPVRIPIPTVILASAILLCGGSCSTKKPSFRSECPSLDAGDYYFPKGVLDPSRPKVDEIIRDWYSKYLKAMMEPSLSCGARKGGFAYRFLWLRSFHHPIAVRVENDGSAVTVNAVELDGTGGSRPGGVVKRTQRILSRAEQNQFLAQLNQVGVGEMQREAGRFGEDGAQWVLEGTENDQYQVVQRWSPGPGAYRDLCDLLLNLAGLRIPVTEFY